MRALRRTLRSLLCLSLLAALAQAQSPLGRLAGTAQDQTGAIVAGALVTLTDEGTAQERTALTTAAGNFSFPQLTAGAYTVQVALAGFKTAVYRQVKIEPGQEYSLNASLALGESVTVVQVIAGADLVHTTSPEVSETVAQRQMLDLPLKGRNTLELVRLQAGVPGIITRTPTAINGGRPSWTQVTQDGINIQDNYLRTDALDELPGNPGSDIIGLGEFTVITNTQGADAAGGASLVKLITPAGANQLHGNLTELYRNSALAANTWFNNRAGIALPALNRHQFGGRVGGPLLKSKLFFFAFYEGFRQSTGVGESRGFYQATGKVRNMIIPAHDDLLTGVFRYVRQSDGSLQAVNVLQLAGVALDPHVKRLILDRVPSAAHVNNFKVGDSVNGRLLNSAGFSFNQRAYQSRNQFGFRNDYQAHQAHRLEFTFARSGSGASDPAQVADDSATDTIHPKSRLTANTTPTLAVGAWRWTISPRLHNEIRAGVNLVRVATRNREELEGLRFDVPLLTNPIVTSQPHGREIVTRQFIDNAVLVSGNHSFQCGGSLQQVRVNLFNDSTRFPSITFGFNAATPTNLRLTAARFPGGSISPSDLDKANQWVALLGGLIGSVHQGFGLQDKTSGFVAGLPPRRSTYRFDDLAGYFQDDWRLKPNLSLRAGLKWEYFSPLRQERDLAQFPVLNGRAVREVLLDPNVARDFVNGDFYQKDLNNFAPAFGLAWAPRKNGKTSLRAGYTLAYINEEVVRVGERAATINERGGTIINGSNRLTDAALGFVTFSAALPPVPPPSFNLPAQMPYKYANDSVALLRGAQLFAIDPRLRQPYVHELSLSFERELPNDFAVEGRYVATLGRKIWRGLDLNQLRLSTDFLADYRRARRNGFLAQAAGGGFNPSYNPQLPGSQPLTVIPNLGGNLLREPALSYLRTGEVGSLAGFFTDQVFARAARDAFVPNPSLYAANLVTNGAETDYHALQVEARRRFRQGFFGQFNYTFGKVLATSGGTRDDRFEPALDNARPELEKTRAEFDLTHILHANLLYELPAWRFRNVPRGLRQALAGWQVNTIFHWQSGAPFSILSGRGTFNRATRSLLNPANASLTRAQIRALLGMRKLAGGVFYFDPQVIDPATGKAAGPDNPDNTAGFPGQVFFNPAAGTVGTLQRLQFDGPAQFAWDLSLLKRTRVSERFELEFRAEFFNVLNHPSFAVEDFNINANGFGGVNALSQEPRVIQFAVRLNF
jgi:hypothetical protein